MATEKTSQNQNAEAKTTSQDNNIFETFAAELKNKLNEQIGKSLVDQKQADYIYQQFINSYKVYFAE